MGESALINGKYSKKALTTITASAIYSRLSQ